MISTPPTKIQAADPAAGSEVTYTVPTGVSIGLVSLSVNCVQGLTQTPWPILVIDDGTDILFASPGSTAAQAVSTTCRYTWGQDVAVSGQIGSGAAIYSIGALMTGMHRIPLGPGYRIRTITTGIGANTDYGVASLWVVQY
jgi:hypothetical protein